MNRKAVFVLLMLCSMVFSCGGGEGSDTITVPPPPAPQNVLSAGGNSQAYLSWKAVSDATTYNIYWSTTAGVDKQSGAKISVAASPYYHTGLNNGIIYYYIVTAVNKYGESAESFQVSATPGQFNPPLPPRDVVPFSFHKRVIIRWTALEAADVNTSYNIYWSTSKDVTKRSGIKIADAPNPYTHVDLTNGLTYYYVITGVNQYGEGLASQEVSATPDQGNLPSPPTGITTVVGDRKATISWNPVSNASTYNIYWSTSPDMSSQSGTKLANVKSPYTYSGLILGETYYYVITAVNGFGESDDSIKSSVKIPDNRKDICVAMGDSITAGDFATSYSNSYVSLLSARWGKTIINEGVGGVRATYGAFTIDEILSRHNPRYITIYFGTNDLGNTAPDNTINDLRYIIERAKENGTVPVVATMGPFLNHWAWRQPYATDLSRRIRELAAIQGIACADIEAALGGNSNYMDEDGQHPIDAGHRIIAETFHRALTQ
jgi:lysophospholipase L1-like esterase